MLANATAMMTATQSQLCFAYANRNYVPKGNANFTTLRFAHKENIILIRLSGAKRNEAILHFAFKKRASLDEE